MVDEDLRAVTFPNSSTIKCLSFLPISRGEDYTWLFKTTFLLTPVNNSWAPIFLNLYSYCKIDRQNKKILLKNDGELFRVLNFDCEESLSSVWRFLPNK